MSHLTGERITTPSDHLSGISDVNRRKQQSQQPRQLLSCTKCRERKVKCDRTKPCSACCARGAPKDCHFIAEGGDYAPIQQSYELRKLRTENLRLKERLRASKISIEDEDSDHAPSPDSQLGERPGSSQRRRVAKQKRFQGSEWQDSIYFGSPGLASVIHDFASANIEGSTTLTHLMPRGAEMYTTRGPPLHPFATLFAATPEECYPQLLSCLPSDGEVTSYLKVFENRVNICSFPHVPVEITRSEVDRFLSDRENNTHTCPDMLALLFAAIALGAQYSVWEKSGERWDAHVMNVESRKGDVFIAAAMQALRLASFMQKPSLLNIQTLIMLGPYLTNSGRFLDAWTLFGTTIRLAHSIGLHRHPKYLNPVPSTQRECSIRQTLWWWMLHMDEQYSMTLGRPLGISGFGDCPSPQELTTDPTMLRFGVFVNRFTILARNILSSDRLTNVRIDEFTDALRSLQESMPETLQYDESWNRNETEVPEWSLRAMAVVYFCKLHTYLVLLNRQRIEKQLAFPQPPLPRDHMSSFRAINRTPSSQPSPASSTQAPLRGRALVLSSSEDMISAFMFFYHKEPAALIDWTLGQQAFNSCMILLFDAIEVGRITNGTLRVEQAFVVFKELEDNDVHKLAGLAVERISWGLTELHKIVTSSSMGSTSTHAHQGASTSTPITDHREVMCETGCVDTVMGKTGMLLLEDSGLQTFARQAYTPIAWDMPGSRDEDTKEQGYRLPDTVSTVGAMKSETISNDPHDLRSPGGMQGIRRSTTMRSAPTRYAISLEDNEQPHGHTTPASPTRFASSHRPAFDDARKNHHNEQPRDQVYPPHLLHTQLHEVAPVVHRTGNSGWQHESVPVSSNPAQQQHGITSLTSAAPQHASITQLRHNSCPTLPQGSIDPPILRPTYSSPSNIERPIAARLLQQHASYMTPDPVSMRSDQTAVHAYFQGIPSSMPHIGNPTMHPSFVSRSAVPMSSIAEVNPTFAVMANHAQHNAASGEVLQQQYHMGYPFPNQITGASPSTLTPLAQDMSLGEWRRYVGSSNAG